MNNSDPARLADRFWKELGDVRTGMLGLAGAREAHSQPMTAHFEGNEGPIWFFARSDGELVRAVSGEQKAVFHYVGPDHELYACVHGRLVEKRDQAVIDRFWSDEVERWFPDGPQDRSVTMLRFDPGEAQIWLPSESAETSTLDLAGGQEDADVRAKVLL